MIFQRLASRPHGFGELRRAMPDVSAKVLREQLRQMQADGLVARHALTPARLGVRYRVTAYGLTLGPVFDALWRWGTGHVARRDADRERWCRRREHGLARRQARCRCTRAAICAEITGFP